MSQQATGAAAICEAVGIPLLEMRCPECKATQRFKIRSAGPHLTACTTCKTKIIATPVVRQKPNRVLIELELLAIPFPKKLAVVA